MSQGMHAYHPVKLDSGSTVSAAVNIGRETLVGFHFPTGFESATVTFKAALEQTGEYFPVYDPSIADTLVAVYSKAGSIVPVPLPELAVLQNFEIVASNAATEDRTIYVITRPAV